MSIGNLSLRAVTFLLHFLSAIFLAGISVRCSESVITRAYTESVTDSSGFILIMDVTCPDPETKDCFYGAPQAYDVRQEGLQWNVLALLASFEWLSASFALSYLDETSSIVALGCLLWNIAGVFLFMPYTMPVTLLQSGLTVLAMVSAIVMEQRGSYLIKFHRSEKSISNKPVSGAAKSDGDKSNADNTLGYADSYTRVIQHYSEYCASASFLFVAVLILFVPDPLSWTATLGLIGVFLCNLFGISTHHCKLDQHSRESTPFYSLDWGNCGNHFKLLLMHSWLSLATAVGIIIYTGRAALLDENVPQWVRFILWNLIVTYSAFGIWATICYNLAGSRKVTHNFDKWMARLDYGLTILSVAAKLPVAFTVYYGLIREPGASYMCK